MKKHLLIFAWEYYGYHSRQGTALSKRPRQVAESFITNGWDVTVIHKDQLDESKGSYFISFEENGIKRISVPLTKSIDYFDKHPLLRKIETLYYTTFHGDRTYRWANDVINNFPSFNIAKPLLIISFFTPRVPLYLGDYFSRKLSVPWIADLQDPIYEGISGKSFLFCRYWMRHTLKSASAIVHVSPEWAWADAERLNRNVHTIRHAVVESTPHPIPVNNNTGNIFKIFYGGSIIPEVQSLALLKKVILAVDTNNIKIFLAGNSATNAYFQKELDNDLVNYLGWLSVEEMNLTISNCNCTLVIACSKDRVCIPSKFYELCAYEKPLWIIGDDIGAFSTLFDEWGHTPIGINKFEYQKKALVAALTNDYSYMFDIKTCKKEYIKTTDLFREYIKLIQ